MPTTLIDVAAHAGVSPATASRVLNGSRRGVSAILRERVHRAAQVLEYVPNAHAQALVRSRTSIVGVIVHDVSDPYFSEIVRGIQHVASSAGQLVVLCNSYRDPARELEYLALLRAQRVQAIVLAGSGIADEAYRGHLCSHIEAFTRDGGHAAFIGRHAIDGDAVIPDNPGGGQAVARALLELGHRHIGVIKGPMLITSTGDRFDGFRVELERAGLALRAEDVVEADFSREGGEWAAGLLLDRHPGLTAIFALNDAMALGALGALRQRGISVPHQVSLVGFDDIPLARDVTPSLTTVHVPMRELGARAMALALDTALRPPQVVYLPTAIVLRGSTGPAPA
jgi:LacI family transcriptional regulator